MQQERALPRTIHRDVRVETRTGDAILPLMADLQRLRVQVFREWPYLYDGEETYETTYIRAYAKSPRAAIVAALDGPRCVGASTCLPMQDETANLQAPFLARGWDPARFFYFGESVLLPEYRGQGIGVAFFAQREAHARAVSDAAFACFCAVERPADHPARPLGAAGLEGFWRKRGYQMEPGLACTMRWKEVGQAEQTSHRLQFWIKPLREGARL